MPDNLTVEQEWATARGYDLCAPHWDDLAPVTQEAVRRVVRNVRAERDAARAECEALVNEVVILRRERAEAHNERDRYKAALEEIYDDVCSDRDCDAARIARTALDADKERDNG